MCSETREHRRRVECRLHEAPAATGPTWDEVVSRDYRPWDRDRIVVETAGQTVEQVVSRLRGLLPAAQP